MECTVSKNSSSAFKRLKSFFSHQAGSVVIIASLVLPVLLGFVGFSLDYIRAYSLRTTLQGGIDAAVLAGVSSSQDQEQQISAAQAFFDTISSQLEQSVSVSFNHDGDNLIGTASTTIDTTILGILSIDDMDVGVEAIATAAKVHGSLCFMAMHPTRKHTLELKDSVSVIAPDCNIYGNSSHSYDVVDPHKPENYLIGKSVQAIGYGHHYLENVTPPLEYAPELIPDPLASLNIPTPGACDHEEMVVNGGTTTLNPGVYCNGLEIRSGANVTLNPGVYIITGDRFKVDQSTLQGDGITIVLADNNVKIEWRGNSEIHLSAPKTGPYTSIALMGVREFVEHKIDKAVIDIHGIIYLPMGKFEWRNTGEASIDAMWTVWIIDGVTWKGDGKIYINFEPDDSDIPYPKEWKYLIPRPGTPRLIS